LAAILVVLDLAEQEQGFDDLVSSTVAEVLELEQPMLRIHSGARHYA